MPEPTRPAGQPAPAPAAASPGSSLPSQVVTCDLTPTTAGSAAQDGPGADGAARCGRFTLLRPHAAGGLGEVLIAEDEELHRTVAFKRIRPDRAGDPEARRRFLLEAEITGKLEHPGVVPIYGLVRDADGQPCYAMRFIEGESLQEAIQAFHRGRQPWDGSAFRQLLARFLTVCQTVAYAHSRGIIHRDLKPANVMLGKFGETLAVDWGLARPFGAGGAEPSATDPSPSLPDAEGTHLGQAVGTPAYMSPEQAAGRWDVVGPASDVYGLGAVLYELLTGRRPVQGRDAADVLAKVRRGDFPPPRHGRPDVPRALEAVCLRALALRPEDRYAGARDLADEVEHWLADEPVRALREPAHVRLRRWARRHRPLVASLGTAAVLLLATAVLAGFWLFRAAQREREQVRREAEKRLAAGLGAGRAGNLGHALQDLAEVGELGDRRPDLDELRELRDQARRHAAQFERYQALRRGVQALQSDNLAELVARLRKATGTRPSAAAVGQTRHRARVERCTQALALYRVEEDGRWAAALADGTLLPAQADDVRRLVAQALDALTLEYALGIYPDKADPATNRRALVLLDRAAALHGATHAVWLLRAVHHRRLHDDAAAERATHQRRQNPPRTAHDHYVLGAVSLHIGNNPRAALEAYRHATHLAPDHFNAHLGQFLCHSQLKDVPGQVQALTTCLVLRPDDVYLSWLRGMVHFTAGKHAWAREDFDATVRRDPAFALGWYYRGRMTIALAEEEGEGRWAKAEHDLGRALDADRTLGGVHAWRAIARAKLNRHAEAAADAEEAVRREPDDALTNFYAARAYAQAVRAARADARLAGRERLARRYADRCLVLLATALRWGFDEFERLQPGTDFDPVRAEPRFRELIEKR